MVIVSPYWVSNIFSNDGFQTKVSMYRALTDAMPTGKRLHSVRSAEASPVHQSVPDCFILFLKKHNVFLLMWVEIRSSLVAHDVQYYDQKLYSILSCSPFLCSASSLWKGNLILQLNTWYIFVEKRVKQGC